MEHLRYAGLSPEVQEQVLIEIVRSDTVLMELLSGLRVVNLPDWLLVSGAIYNNVWNHLTNRDSMTGVKDFDVFYFDDSDLSYGAEDAVIKQAEKAFAHLPLPVEVRNQARVHLWAPQKFGIDFDPLKNSAEMIQKFASKTHCVGVKLTDDDEMQIVAPFGLNDVFSFRIVPNYELNNRHAHETKAMRAKNVWPELEIVPW